MILLHAYSVILFFSHKLFPPQNPSSGVEILLRYSVRLFTKFWNLSNYETLSVNQRFCTSSQHITNDHKVLRAVLEPRGLMVDRIRSAATEELAAKRRPSVMVLHVDEVPSLAARPADWQNVPRIVIGATKINDACERAAGEHYLEQPFQYGELIRTIERLLAAAAD